MTKEQTTTGYNGWKNRQTWNVMLWLDNDEGAYRSYQERVKEYKRRNPNRRILPGFVAKLWAKDALGDRTPDGISLNGNRVNWREIAAAMLET